MCETPPDLEPVDNEDSCDYCDQPVWEDGRYDYLCYDCHMEAYEEETAERKAEVRAEREYDDDDNSWDHYYG